MISEINANAYCIDDISQIENYEEAISDTNNSWICHHRLEASPDGVEHTREELKSMGLYYHRPASELIFLTKREHSQLHQKTSAGIRTIQAMLNSRVRKHSMETKKKISEAKKENPVVGRVVI